MIDGMKTASKLCALLTHLGPPIKPQSINTDANANTNAKWTPSTFDRQLASKQTSKATNLLLEYLEARVLGGDGEEAACLQRLQRICNVDEFLGLKIENGDDAADGYRVSESLAGIDGDDFLRAEIVRLQAINKDYKQTLYDQSIHIALEEKLKNENGSEMDPCDSSGKIGAAKITSDKAMVYIDNLLNTVQAILNLDRNIHHNTFNNRDNIHGAGPSLAGSNLQRELLELFSDKVRVSSSPNDHDCSFSEFLEEQNQVVAEESLFANLLLQCVLGGGGNLLYTLDATARTIRQYAEGKLKKQREDASELATACSSRHQKSPTRNLKHNIILPTLPPSLEISEYRQQHDRLLAEHAAIGEGQFVYERYLHEFAQYISDISSHYNSIKQRH